MLAKSWRSHCVVAPYLLGGQLVALCHLLACVLALHGFGKQVHLLSHPAGDVACLLLALCYNTVHPDRCVEMYVNIESLHNLSNFDGFYNMG